MEMSWLHENVSQPRAHGLSLSDGAKRLQISASCPHDSHGQQCLGAARCQLKHTVWPWQSSCGHVAPNTALMAVFAAMQRQGTESACCSIFTHQTLD